MIESTTNNILMDLPDSLVRLAEHNMAKSIEQYWAAMEGKEDD